MAFLLCFDQRLLPSCAPHEKGHNYDRENKKAKYRYGDPPRDQSARMCANVPEENAAGAEHIKEAYEKQKKRDLSLESHGSHCLLHAPNGYARCSKNLTSPLKNN